MAVFCVGATTGVFAQDTAQKTQDLIAALDKTKYKKKEKKNITIEIYVDVKNEPVVKKNLSEYAGLYISDGSGYRLELRIASNGLIEGSGYDIVIGDDSQMLNFTLKDARIEGALLTGTKVFENGETQKFEAVFANRTVVSGKNKDEISTRNTSYGIGFIQSQTQSATALSEDSMTNRVFLEFRK